MGTLLLERLEAEAKRAGALAAHLEVADANPKAQRLYTVRGYRLHDRRLMTRRLD